jgi:hypothetical protein
LDIFFHWEVKISDFLTNNEANLTSDVRTATAAIALDVEDLLPHAPVWVNTKENFTGSDKNRKVENEIRRHLPKLNTA